MNHQLIKHEPHDGNGTTPRWVYKAENKIIKTNKKHEYGQTTVGDDLIWE